MSQIQSFVESMGPSGPVLTLTSDDAISVGPTGGTIFVEGLFNSPVIGFAQTEGHAVQSTLAIVPLHASLTTVDGTYNIIYSVTLPDDTAVVLAGTVIGVRDDFGAVCGGTTNGIARKPGAGAVTGTGGGVITTDYIGNPAPNVLTIATGTTIKIMVRGVAAETWNWTAQVIYQFVL